MALNIKTIIFGGMVGNCYLLKTKVGFILIDTGKKSKRIKLEKELRGSGCHPGDLKLIILTHGDFDHTGNCAYLRSKYNVKIAIHVYDSGMVEYGNMYWNKRKGNRIFRKIINFIYRIKKFKPDLIIDEGFNLSEYGLNARIIYLPGHSKGSIGILTSEGDLFCGDLFVNKTSPEINSIMDNQEEASFSVGKLKNFYIDTVYPGHGKPFSMNHFEEYYLNS